MNGRLAFCLVLSLVLNVAAVSTGVADDSPQKESPKSTPAKKLVPAKAAKPAVDRANLEKQFAEQLSGATLVGSYTTDGQRGKPAADESYEISKVAKAADGQWLFLVRMKFGDVDVTLPLKIPVEWAGDTPIISLTNFKIPGLGTFTSRVIIYRDRYAGTWQHDKVGGHLFGRIVRNGAPANK